MNAFLLSVVLLGQYDDPWLDKWQDRMSRERDAQFQRETQVRVSDEQIGEDRTNTYIIGGAIVAGLFLLGLMMRSGKK